MIRDPEALDRLLEDTRRFVREVAIPNEDRVEAEDRVPEECVAAMRELGTFGWSIPEEYGGKGLTSEELALAFIELTQCSVAYRVVGAQNAGIGSETIIRDGTEEQKRTYLPKLATGEMLGCLALTEENAGSDATALETIAEISSRIVVNKAAWKMKHDAVVELLDALRTAVRANRRARPAEND